MQTKPLTRRPLTPAATAARDTKAVATTTARGETLWFDGYCMTATETFAVYTVTTPERINKKTGEVYVIDYTVDVMGQTCNCWMFARAGGAPCKHLIGADNAIVAAHEAVQAAAALLTPRRNAAPVTPRPMPVPLGYVDTGAQRQTPAPIPTPHTPRRWTPDMIPAAAQEAITRAGALNRDADFG